MTQTIYTNAQIVRETEVIKGTLVAEDGKIVEVSQGSTSIAGAIDLDGDLLLPGLVELHTDNLERHLEPRPRVDWPHAAAILAHDAELASAGITTVFDAMRIGSIHEGKAGYQPYARSVSREVMDLREKGALKINHYLHLRAEVCSETLEAEFADFTAEDRVGLVSLMDHTPGQRQFRDLSALKTYVQKKRGMTDDDFAEHVDHLLTLRATYGEKHEVATVREAARLGAVLASHDDTTADQVETSRANGVRVAEFPTTVEAAQACKLHGIAVMMGAPNLIRGGSHSGNVAAHELAERGLLDIISSDYVPYALLSSAFLLADLWDDVARAITCVTSSPANAVNLTDRGRIAEGCHADLVRVARIEGTPVVRGVWCHGRQVG
ncbi:alpha-D-ribose 1-methylphosphonate 5-triphosphate diphosphatase [Celeribacter litoreus]|uniref:alpha-D-ribose 1-methylphosphonate 5-triphosphate diphosphatase n=1 Tax=Celeribacter litoreus TaxID=2876714 RepID=UPI001CCCAAB3|nr:alpha-D-ribose 1-methylphosphonate 5-triphosphate diphosphatase [Celeribacter litoreus]MCA0044773.1 alpha-D-ribose 1-methylphosphonate 5-triphosphate diphosphatase [Celeribacter litoreus]